MFNKLNYSNMFISNSFLFLWLFHLLSLFGSEMTRFALPIWFYEKNQDLITFSIFMFAGLLPRIFSFIIGSCIDYLNPKKTMFISGISLIFISIGFNFIISKILDVKIWQIYLLIFFMGLASNSIHIAAMSALSKIINKEHLLKGNSLIISAESLATFLSPLIAGFLIYEFGIYLIIWIDICFFIFALTFLFFIKNLNQKTTNEKINFLNSIKNNITDGFKFIKKDRDFLFLIFIFSMINFAFTLSFSFLTPMILSLTNFDPKLLGLVNSIGVGGQLIGAIIAGYSLKITNKISTILRTLVFLGFCGPCLISLNPSPLFWATGYAITLGLLSIINSLNNAFWQLHSPEKLQGTIFGIRRMFTSLAAPFGALMAGPILNLLSHFSITMINEYQLLFFLSGLLISALGLIGLMTVPHKQMHSIN